MLCSVGYHLFSCHRSEKTSRRWLALDYAGISVGILGCYVPGIFYAFYCDAVSVTISEPSNAQHNKEDVRFVVQIVNSAGFSPAAVSSSLAIV